MACQRPPSIRQRYVLGRCGLQAVLATLAALETAQAAHAAEPEAPVPVKVLEAARETARHSATWLARTVDGWFGDAPHEGGPLVTNGRLTLGVFKRQDQTVDIDTRFSARFTLPNVQRQAYLFIGRDDLRDTLRDTPETLQAQQALAPRLGERALFAGLGVTLYDAVDFRLGLGSRLKPYGQAKVRKVWPLATGHTIEASETLFWTHDERFGATTALSYDIAASRHLALRWLNVGTLTQRTRRWEWTSTWGAYRGFDGERLLSVEAVANGTGRPGYRDGPYDLGLLAKWEQPVYQRWVFVEGLTGHHWTRLDGANERTRAWALGVNLKLRF